MWHLRLTFWKVKVVLVVKKRREEDIEIVLYPDILNKVTQSAQIHGLIVELIQSVCSWS